MAFDIPLQGRKANVKYYQLRPTSNKAGIFTKSVALSFSKCIFHFSRSYRWSMGTRGGIVVAR